MKKSLGMFVLMTVICVAVFMLFMAIGPRPAKAQGSSYFGADVQATNQTEGTLTCVAFSLSRC
jgi:hypothetical protein